MITFGFGSLSYVNDGLTVTDGISYFKVLAPSLILRFFRRKLFRKTRTKHYQCGRFILFNDTVIFFIKKPKRVYFPIKEERNISEIIKERRLGRNEKSSSLEKVYSNKKY